MAGQVDLHALESAAFGAWPALETGLHAGWTLRFARGYTQRANSANATASSSTLGVRDFEAIEAAYAERGLRPIFRLVSFDAAAQAADAALAARGYRAVDASLVMTAALDDDDAARPWVPLVRQAPDAATWLAHYRTVTGKGGAGQGTHLEMLRSIRGEVAFAWEPGVDGTPACCGLGVALDGVVGLFDVATSPAARGQGLATRLCAGLMAWGRERGAHTAYLQVVETNATAIRLYERLGFGVAYGYGYRVK